MSTRSNACQRLRTTLMLAGGAVAAGLAFGYVVYRQVKAGHEIETEEIPMASLSAAEDQARLQALYDSMAENFVTQNLDTEYISSIVKYYGEKKTTSHLWRKSGRVQLDALTYVEVDGPEARDMSRLVILSMENDQPIAETLYKAATQVMELLPMKTKIFQSPAEILHITLFHMSRVQDPVPLKGETGELEEYLTGEMEELTAVVEACRRPSLVLHRVVLADSGVLLALWFDETEAVSEMRRQLKAHCPNAPAKQTEIIHTTLFRIASPELLSSEVQARIIEKCHELTERLSGLCWSPEFAKFVREEHFSTVQGPSLRVRLLNSPSR